MTGSPSSVDATPEQVATKLSAEQRDRLLSFSAEPRQMGIGLSQFLPEMVEPDGFNHPIFGPHYRLTGTGRAVRDHLKGT